MIGVGRKGFAATLLAVLLAGCSHGPVRVDCERHLVPINAPAPAVPMVERKVVEEPEQAGGQR